LLRGDHRGKAFRYSENSRMSDNYVSNVRADELSTGNAPPCQEQAISSMEPATRELVGKIYQTRFK